MSQPLTQYEMLLGDARLGELSRNFFKSQLGRFVLDRIEAAEEAAVAKLKTVDPFDGKSVQSIQNEINVAIMARQYLVEAIIIGDNAIRLIESEDQEINYFDGEDNE